MLTALSRARGIPLPSESFKKFPKCWSGLNKDTTETESYEQYYYVHLALKLAHYSADSIFKLNLTQVGTTLSKKKREM